MGRHDFDAHLPEIAERSVSDIDRMRATALGQLRSLGLAADPEVRADLDVSQKLLEAERFRITELGRAYSPPITRVAEADVTAYLRSPYAPLADRVAALIDHLSRLPRFLQEAAAALEEALPAGERLQVMEAARAQAADIAAIPGQIEKEHPELDTSALATVAAPAIAACEDFGRAVEKKTPAKALLGPERLGAFLLAAEGIDRPVAELLEEAEAEVRSAASALDAAAAKLGVEHRLAVYELMASQVTPGPVVESLRSAVSRVRDFWLQKDVVSVQTAIGLELSSMPPDTGAAEVKFFISPVFEKVKRPHVLRVPELPDSGESGGAVIRRQYLNDPMLEVIALHEAFAGHYVHTEAGMRGPSTIRTCILMTAGFSEGWAHYAEELAVEQGLADGRPFVEAAQLRSALEAAMRLLIFLSVNAGRWTFAQAVSQAMDLCDWSAARAAREVLASVCNWHTAMYTFGKLRIREWRTSIGSPTTGEQLRRFHDRILQCGLAPLSTVWQYYIDGQSLADLSHGASYPAGSSRKDTDGMWKEGE